MIGPGLTSVPENVLTMVLKWVFQGRIPCPISGRDLMLAGLEFHSDALVSALAGLDARATQVVLAQVIHERRAWRKSGPE